MSILIKGMDMPEKTYAHCMLIKDIDGSVELHVCTENSEYMSEWERYCLVPVPPHGDLFDRAELWVEINKICDRRDAGIITDLACLQQILSAVRHAPTIIPAEEGET